MPYFLMTFQKINLGNISNQNYLSFPLTIQEVWYIIIKQFNEITCVEAHSTTVFKKRTTLGSFFLLLDFRENQSIT